MGRQKVVKAYAVYNEDHDVPSIPNTTQKRIPIPIGSDDDKILIVLYLTKIKRKTGYFYKTVAFTVIYAILYKERWIYVRKHCWMLHSSVFHTHIRLGLGKKKKKTIHQAEIKDIKKALKWSKNDILKNWYKYKNKLVKAFDKGR